MMCFRDMTFCAASCGNVACPRNFTEDQAAAARRWWGDAAGGPPVAFADYAKTCTVWQPETPAAGSGAGAADPLPESDHLSETAHA